MLSAIVTELSPAERARYHRQVILPGHGTEGQLRLKEAKVLVLGLGGLGSPASLYLAAAGVGTLGLVDHDVVETHNLHRQIIHDTEALAGPKTASAARKLRALNPDVEVVEHGVELTAANAEELFRGYDVIVDGSDNFPTRYLVNDAAVLWGKPLVYGSIFQFEGQVSVFDAANGGPCYRCLFPEPPKPGTVPNCAEAGVFGALCGMIGSLQAMEAIKLITGLGEPLRGRLTVVDALAGTTRTIRVKRDRACPVCGETPTLRSLDPARYAEDSCEVMAADESEVPGEIDVQTAQDWLASENPPVVLDVREPDERVIAKIEGSLFIPMKEVGERLAELPRDRTILVQCHHGGRSARLTKLLRDKGFTKAVNLAGGIDAWSREIDPGVQRY